MSLILSQEEIARENQMALSRREMQRRSLDTIRIYNPLPDKFSFMYDGRWHSVEGNKTKDVSRFLAAHYFKYISNHIIGLQQKAEGKELLEMRKKQFGKTFLDKYEENKEVWDRVPKLNDQNLLKEIYDRVILGVVEEYGMDIPEETPQSSHRIDLRSMQDQLFYSQPDRRVESPSVSEVTNE